MPTFLTRTTILVSLGVAIAFNCLPPANAQVTYVNGKRYILCGGKLYPMINANWKTLDGVVHENWITDYSSWIPPKTKPMDLADSKPISVAPSNYRKAEMDTNSAAFSVKDEGSKHYITLNADVLFDFNKFDLNEKAEKVLEKLVPIIKGYGNCSVAITGHTDSIGTDAYNQTLSEQRAASVKDWLTVHGTVEGNISTSGMGKRCPVAPNTYLDGSDCPVGRARNRRVELLVDTAVARSQEQSEDNSTATSTE